MFIKEVFAQQSGNLGDHYSFGWLTSLGEALNYLIKPAFAIAALAVILYLLFGAVKFVFSAGNKESIASARGMIVHAFVGFILLLLMFLIMQFIPQFFGINIKIIQ